MFGIQNMQLTSKVSPREVSSKPVMQTTAMETLNLTVKRSATFAKRRNDSVRRQEPRRGGGEGGGEGGESGIAPAGEVCFIDSTN